MPETLSPAPAEEPNKDNTPPAPEAKSTDPVEQAAGVVAAKSAEAIAKTASEQPKLDPESERDAQRIESLWQQAIDKTALKVGVERANKAADTLAAANAKAEQVLANSSVAKPTPDFLKNVPIPNTEPEPTTKPATPDFLKNVPLPDTEPEPASKPVTPDFLKNVPVPKTEDETVLAKPGASTITEPIRTSPLFKKDAGAEIKPVVLPSLDEQPATPAAAEKDTTAQAETSAEAPERAQFNELQADLIATLGEQGVSVAMYRQGNEVRADYTDKNGKRIGLETIRSLFGDKMSEVATTVGKLEAFAYTNPELFALRETPAERTSRQSSELVDRLGKRLIDSANKLKPRGLWSQAKQWFSRGKERAAGISAAFQAKLSEIQRGRSEQRAAINFQRFAKNFNLLTPDMIRADRAMVALSQEIDAKSQKYIEAADIASGLGEEIRRLQIMEARLGRMKEIRSLQKRRENFQRQMNMLNGQLNKLKTSYTAVDQELKQQQALEAEGLEAQLRAKTPEKPAYYSQEQEMDETLAKNTYVGPELSEPAYDNAPEDRTAKLGKTTTDFDRAKADEAVGTVDTSTVARTIPLGPPPAAPDTAPPVADSAPEAGPGQQAA